MRPFVVAAEPYWMSASASIWKSVTSDGLTITWMIRVFVVVPVLRPVARTVVCVWVEVGGVTCRSYSYPLPSVRQTSFPFGYVQDWPSDHVTFAVALPATVVPPDWRLASPGARSCE